MTAFKLKERKNPMATPDNKAKINTDYYMIQLDSEWSSYVYAVKHNQMDQDDRYNFATKNWSYDLEDLENRAYDILHILTCKEDHEIAKIM